MACSESVFSTATMPTTGQSRHADCLLRWLRSATDHHLCVLACNDAVALLDGKPFVSAPGERGAEATRCWVILPPETTIRCCDERRAAEGVGAQWPRGVPVARES